MSAQSSSRDREYVKGVAHQYKERYPWTNLVDLELTGALAASQIAYRTALERSMEAVGVGRTIGRSTLLRALYFAGEPLTQTEIRRQLRVSAATVTFMLNGLEKEALVSKVRQAEDRRTFHVTLTEAGREMAERLLPMMPRLSLELWNGFNPEEKQALLDYLLRFLDGVLAYNSQPVPPAALDNRDQEPSITDR